MNTKSANPLFTEVNPEEAERVNGGNVFTPYDYSGYYNDLYSTYPISGFDPVYSYGVYQGVFPYVNSYITNGFSNGSSMYDGLNAIQNLVNWASSPL